MESKKALDKIIRKSRVHFYKPIQIAEILYHYRNGANIDPADLESYRNISKTWRDQISKRLVGRICTSSQKFQDNLFESNAMPPALLVELAEYNNKTDGLVENYIYHKIKNRMSKLFEAIQYLDTATPETFDLNDFIGIFTEEPGLRRSIDKVYEITVYALFSTIVRALRLEVSLSIKNLNAAIMSDFEEFLKLVVGLSKDKTEIKIPAKLFRVGVTNAADRGLDMWANFGPAIQVKHVSLSEDIAEDVTENITADRIVLICLDGETEIIQKISNQMPFSDRIQGIITLSDIERWYTTCLSEKYRGNLGQQVLVDFKRELSFEFPCLNEIEPLITERGYKQELIVDEWSLT